GGTRAIWRVEWDWTTFEGCREHVAQILPGICVWGLESRQASVFSNELRVIKVIVFTDAVPPKGGTPNGNALHCEPFFAQLHQGFRERGAFGKLCAQIDMPHQGQCSIGLNRDSGMCAGKFHK